MKKIKHSKFKNTGVLFELLVRQITLEVLNGDKTENAKRIVKEFFSPGTELNKELRSSFDIEQFLSSPISNYKVLASIYKVFESKKSENYDIKDVFNSKITL